MEERQRTRFSVGDLKKAYDQYGPTSTEFCECVDNFIKFLQFKYIGRYSEDLQQQCYMKLFESFSYYNQDRLNIASWVYTIVRNQISGWLYKEKQGAHHSEDGLDEIGDEVDDSEMMDGDFSVAIFSSFKRVVFITGKKIVVRESSVSGSNFNKHFLWERQKMLLEA